MPARRDLDSWNTYSDQAPSWLGTDFTKPAHLLFLLSSISFLGDPRLSFAHHGYSNEFFITEDWYEVACPHPKPTK